MPADSWRWCRRTDREPARRDDRGWIVPSSNATKSRGRSEERRVGEEGRSRWWAYHLKKKKKEENGRANYKMKKVIKNAVRDTSNTVKNNTMHMFIILRVVHTDADRCIIKSMRY